MNTLLQNRTKAPTAPTPSFEPVQNGLLGQHQGFSRFQGWDQSHRKPLASQPPLIQAKLAIGEPDDQYEREADRVAETVMRMPETYSCCQPTRTESLQRQATSTATMEQAPSSVYEVLRSPGQPLDAEMRAYMEQRLGHDFGHVRVHTDRRAAESAARIGALAYAVGPNLVFSPGQYRPGTSEGRRLMAHELTHTVQQGEPAVSSAMVRSRRPVPAIQCDVEDPKRFRRVHEGLFHQAGGGGELLEWVDPRPGVTGTEETLFRQAKDAIQQYMGDETNEGYFGGPVTPATTEGPLDTDAVEANRHILSRFPMIPAPASEAQIRSAVSVMTSSVTAGLPSGLTPQETREAVEDRQRQWLYNNLQQLCRSCHVHDYRISETDPRMVAFLNRLLGDRDVGGALQTMASRVAAFHTAEGQGGRVFVHEGLDPEYRLGTVFHELTHFYSHAVFRAWVETTTDERRYSDGFTEYLARLAMPDEVRDRRTEYQGRLDSVNAQVAAHVPVDDIARAYFAGEVWRIETASDVSLREAGPQLGLYEEAAEREEIEASRTGPGINQTVALGRHYRFMNLGFDRPTPKPEHVDFFRRVKSERLDPDPAVAVRFVGHASTAGAPAYNEQLSLRRAQAFYEMAQAEGVSSGRLIDAADPPHFGETRVTATEEDPTTRAFNRRVEMMLQPVADEETEAQTIIRRRSRVDVATSVQAYRVSYPGSRGGLLTLALLARLRNRRMSASAATAAVGAGERRFGRSPRNIEERAGVSAGTSTATPSGTTAQRRAVVIGNAVYDPGTTMGHTVDPTRPLPGSLTDASRIASALSRRGYSVTRHDNQTATGIDSALNTALTGLGAGSELFFFYSGHGTMEGLIGVDGAPFTPVQMLAIRSAARTAQVNLMINTDSCHTGIFADAIRGAELRDTRTAAAGGGHPTLVPLIDAAIAVQDSKDAYNRNIQAWWTRRYELEATMNAATPAGGSALNAAIDACEAHYLTGALHWNNFVTRTNPLLSAMRTAAAAEGITLRSLTLTQLTSPYNVTGEWLVQAGLDDMDTLTNQVLTTADGRLP